jgi:hypothetical protein
LKRYGNARWYRDCTKDDLTSILKTSLQTLSLENDPDELKELSCYITCIFPTEFIPLHDDPIVNKELYQSIYENTKHMTTPLDDTQKANIIQLIPRLDQKGQDLLFFLIRMYHNQQSQDITFQLPYTATADKSDSTSKDIEFDLESANSFFVSRIFFAGVTYGIKTTKESISTYFEKAKSI